MRRRNRSFHSDYLGSCIIESIFSCPLEHQPRKHLFIKRGWKGSNALSMLRCKSQRSVRYFYPGLLILNLIYFSTSSLIIYFPTSSLIPPNCTDSSIAILKVVVTCFSQLLGTWFAWEKSICGDPLKVWEELLHSSQVSKNT